MSAATARRSLPRTEGDFDAWYVVVWPRLVGFAAVHTRDLQEAEDVAAETVARALARWGTGRLADPTAWAFTVAMNLCRRSARRRRRDGLAVLGSVERAWHEPQVRDPDLLAALARLPERQRLAVALHYLGDLTQAQVARSMGVAPGTVAALLNQARAGLRTHLEVPDDHR